MRVDCIMDYKYEEKDDGTSGRVRTKKTPRQTDGALETIDSLAVRPGGSLVWREGPYHPA